MKKFKRIFALTLASTMVIASLPAYAEDLTGNTGTQEGGSYIEGVNPTDVYNFVLPTTTTETYDFVLDPANLLKQYDTDKDKYTQSSVYFTNVGNDSTTYSGTSDVATAVNKSTDALLLKVEATATNVETNPVTFTTAANVEGDTNTNLALSIVPAAKGTVVGNATVTAGAATPAQAVEFNSTGKATAVFYMAADKANNFEIKQSDDATVTSGHKYTYTAKDSATWNTVGFAISGACNTKADWTDFNTASQNKDSGENIELEVVYTIEKLTDDQKAALVAETDPVVPDTTTALVQAFATSTNTTPAISSGATVATDQEYDYTATFTRGTALTLNITGGTVQSATVGGTLAGATTTSASVTTTANTVVLGTGLWATATAGSEKYMVITLADNSTISVKFTIQ